MSGKKDFQFRQLAVQLVKSKQNDNALSSIRAALPSNLYSEFLNELKSFPPERIHMITPEILPTILDLDKFYDLKGINIIDEIKWARAFLIKNVEYLKEFITLSKEFSDSLMLGNILNAGHKLEIVEERFGQSLWLIKNKIAFFQFNDGLEAQKRYVQSIKDNPQLRGYVRFFTHWISIKNESVVTPPRFKLQIDATISKNLSSLSDAHHKYLKYHILGEENVSIQDAADILRFEFSRSLVDYYECFIFFSRVVLLSSDQESKNQIHYTLRSLKGKISDTRIDFLYNLISESDDPNYAQRTAKSFDLLVAGQYEKSYATAIESLTIAPSDPIEISVASLAKCFIKDDIGDDSKTVTEDKVSGPVYLYIIENLSEILRNGFAGAPKQTNLMLKFGLNFSSLQATVAIDNIIEKELTAISKLTVLKSFAFHPFYIQELDNSEVESNYLRHCEREFGDSSGLQFSKQIKEGNTLHIENIGQEEQYYLTAFAGVKNNPTESLEAGFLLVKSNHPYYIKCGHNIISQSYLLLNNIREACSYMASVYINSPRLYTSFPFVQLVEKLDPSENGWQECKDLLALPIILDVYIKYFADEIESQRTYAYEDFLYSHDLNKPSQLADIAALFNKEELIYFLKNICIESVMDMSTEFDSPTDVYIERLAVCKLLTEIDKENSEEYEQEIKDLIRRDFINKRMKEIDQSRVYIDIAKVKERSKLELNEGYARYISFLEHGLDSTIEAQLEEAKAKAENLDIEGLLSMVIPKNEVNSLFKNLVLEVRNFYAPNPEFGLDRFISTRIRHGVIETQLRRPLDTYHLITLREGEKKDYISNTYWIDKLELKESQAKKLDQHFAQFSAGYDELINKIKSEWLQIKILNDDLGLFSFNLTDGEITFLASQIIPTTSIKDFIDIVIKHLDDRLGASLEVIREAFLNIGKKEAIELINSLQKNISRLSHEYIYSDLESAINLARTDIQNVFDRVIDWFIPSESIGTTPYMIEDAVSVAEAIVKEATPSFRSPINLESDVPLALQGGLPTFVDIMVNIFDNVIKRSGLDEPNASVNVCLSEEGDGIAFVNITVTNNLGDGVNIESVRNDLETRKDLLSKNLYTKSIAKEGGSGLFKIQTSLKDFKLIGKERSPSMDFGIKDNTFYVTIIFPVRIQTIDTAA